MRWIAMGGVAGFAGLVALGSCNASSLTSSGTATATVTGAAATMAAQPQPVTSSAASSAAPVAPTFAAAPAEAIRTDFTLEGEMTQGGWIRGKVPSRAISARLNGQDLPLDGEGRFFAAFDRDSGGSATLTAMLADGSKVTKSLTVSPRRWNIEHVNVARRPGGPSAAFMARRRPELAQINAARKANADSMGWAQDFVWPVKGRISGRFGSQRVYRGQPGSYHSGLDIATGASGTPFVAPADGVVTLAAIKPFSLEGHLLIIDHGNGLNSAFLHCSRLAVKEGDIVKRGQYIGNIGSTGRATGPHLHWSIKWRKARLDPLLFVSAQD